MEIDHSTDSISPDDQDYITLGGTGGIVLPVGTTAGRRPGVNGLMRFNSDLSAIEFAVGTSYITLRGPELQLQIITTATGSTQGTAAPINGKICFVNSTPSGTGVILPVPIAGDEYVIINRGSNTLSVYPSTGASIGTLGVNNPSSVNANSVFRYAAITTTAWEVISTASNVTTVNAITQTQPSAGLTLTNSGTPQAGSVSYTFALANDLAAVENLTTTGLAVRTATDAWITRTLTAGSTRIALSNADGVAGNPSIDVTEANLTLNNIGGTLGVSKGGTGLSSTPTNGQLPIGNGTNYTLAALTQGTGITVTNGAGTITITNAGVTSNVATTNQTTVSSASGAVTIGLSSTLVAPGSLTVTSGFQVSSTTSITAAGTTQGTATALTTDNNIITTTAAGTGVVLPAAAAGREVTITNRGANTLNVYPASGSAIDGLAANAATTIATNISKSFTASSATQWYTTADTTTGGGGGGSPGGNTGEVQFNNAGAFAGAANVEIDNGDLVFINTTSATVPAAGTLKTINRQVGGRNMLTMLGPSGIDTAIQPHFGRTKISLWAPAGNSTTITAFGAQALTATGTATIANVATTNVHTYQRRLELLVTTAATTAVAGFRVPTVLNTLGGTAAGLGGFHMICRWGPATGVATTTNRAFVGMANSVAAPTDVEPSSITNMCGMGWDAADTNIQFMYRGAGAVTKVDLGASFPVPTADRTKAYDIAMFSPPGTTQSLSYEITDLGTGAIATGTVTTNLPTTSTFLGPRGWMSVGGTSSVIGIAVMSLYLESDL